MVIIIIFLFSALDWEKIVEFLLVFERWEICNVKWRKEGSNNLPGYRVLIFVFHRGNMYTSKWSSYILLVYRFAEMLSIVQRYLSLKFLKFFRPTLYFCLYGKMSVPTCLKMQWFLWKKLLINFLTIFMYIIHSRSVLWPNCKF